MNCRQVSPTGLPDTGSQPICRNCAVLHRCHRYGNTHLVTRRFWLQDEEIFFSKSTDSCLQCTVLQQVLLTGSFYFDNNASILSGCCSINIAEFTVCLRACIVHTKSFRRRPDAVVLWSSKMGFKDIAVFGNRQEGEYASAMIVQYNDLKRNTQCIEQ